MRHGAASTWSPRGRSFHWFDAEVMFAVLPLLTDQLALLGDSITQSDAQSRVVAIATELLGEEPPRPPRKRYREVLAGSPFSDVDEIDVEAERTWTAESLIGLAYSTSVASPSGSARSARSSSAASARRSAAPSSTTASSVSAVLGRRGDQRLEP